MLHYRLHCSCFILFPSVHTSLFMFHLISLSPHFIDHVSFLFPSVHSPSHSFHLPQSISFMFTLFGCIHITWSFNLIVSFTFQPIPSLEINDLRVSLDKFLILDRYSLLEAELRWFYYSLSLCVGQKKQRWKVAWVFFLKYRRWCFVPWCFRMGWGGRGGLLPGYLLLGLVGVRAWLPSLCALSGLRGIRAEFS